MTYRSGKLNPLSASIPPKIQEIKFCKCLASDLGWVEEHLAAHALARGRRARRGEQLVDVLLVDDLHTPNKTVSELFGAYKTVMSRIWS